MHWSQDSGSLHILGRTQTGKTSAAREIHAENQRISIWLNEQEPNRVEGVTGKRVRGTDAIESGLASDESKFNWIAEDRTVAIRELQRWAWQKADRFDGDVPMQIVVDEIHRLAPQSRKDDLPGRDTVRTIAKEGMKRNIKLIGITQDPVSMDKQTLRQREYLLLFGLAKEQRDTLRDYVDDIDRVFDQAKYEGILFHCEGDAREQAVKARQEYAY
jgi:hypothetical protein